MKISADTVNRYWPEAGRCAASGDAINTRLQKGNSRANRLGVGDLSNASPDCSGSPKSPGCGRTHIALS